MPVTISMAITRCSSAAIPGCAAIRCAIRTAISARWSRIEERLYTNYYLFRLVNLGAAAFYDMGRTWGTTLVPTPQLGLLKDVGVGLRLGNARSSFGSVIHIDLAVPLDRSGSISSLQFLVSTHKSF